MPRMEGIVRGLRRCKTGRGFYTIDRAGSSTVFTDHLTPLTGVHKGRLRSVKTVGVVGSGTMATGIVEVFAKAGGGRPARQAH